MQVTLRVNGQTHQLPAGATVSHLLETLGFHTDGVAVAIDRQVVPRSQHAERVLPEGAEVEVIRAVGGG
jgi:sulfur carrier protein